MVELVTKLDGELFYTEGLLTKAVWSFVRKNCPEYRVGFNNINVILFVRELHYMTLFAKIHFIIFFQYSTLKFKKQICEFVSPAVWDCVGCRFFPHKCVCI